MNAHKLSLIRELIASAIQQELVTHELQIYLAALVPTLHKAISLPEKNPSEALLHFIIRYIEHVPNFLQAFTDLLKDTGTEQYARGFLSIAEDFFLQPLELVRQDSGLKALIDEAYLAHRLIEELNDRLLMLCGVPLTPMDMTMSNIIVHDLLGEEFANQLDLAVHYAIEALFQPDNLARNAEFARFIAQHNHADWQENLKRWPCLAGDSAIHLTFADADPETPTH